MQSFPSATTHSRLNHRRVRNVLAFLFVLTLSLLFAVNHATAAVHAKSTPHKAASPRQAQEQGQEHQRRPRPASRRARRRSPPRRSSRLRPPPPLPPPRLRPPRPRPPPLRPPPLRPPRLRPPRLRPPRLRPPPDHPQPHLEPRIGQPRHDLLQRQRDLILVDEPVGSADPRTARARSRWCSRHGPAVHDLQHRRCAADPHGQPALAARHSRAVPVGPAATGRASRSTSPRP